MMSVLNNGLADDYIHSLGCPGSDFGLFIDTNPAQAREDDISLFLDGKFMADQFWKISQLLTGWRYQERTCVFLVKVIGPSQLGAVQVQGIFKKGCKSLALT